MKILWITNILFPKVSMKIGFPETVIGGWMYSLANILSENDEKITLSVATIYNGKEFQKIVIDNIVYYLIPYSRFGITNKNRIGNFWKHIVLDFNPDLTHLHGTELFHGHIFLNCIHGVKTVISIQGLTSECAKYYYSGLTYRNIFSNITIRNIIKKDSMINIRNKLEKSGKKEISTIKRIKNIIGRTSWDKAHTMTLNPNLNYYFCNETLREAFYLNKWDYEKCEKYSIFISQSESPLKALHQVIRSVYLLKKIFPTLKVYIAGNNITKSDSLFQKLIQTDYGKYLKRLLKKLNLKETFIFIGSLNENEIVKRYLNTNVYICPSSLENSSNSICEAQLLGVPVIASFVGGTSDLIDNGKTGYLYRFEDVEMLSYLISNVFIMDKKELVQLSNNERNIAFKRHDPIAIKNKLVTIYEKILSENDNIIS
jgi:glycosyltransferase involved in cell wall biosynthesis